MTAARPLAERLAILIWRLGFFVPLLFCTYLALVPVPPDNAVFRLSDVILHAAAFTYLTFAFVLMDTGPRFDRSLALRATLVMLAYGVFLEVVQSFIPQRTAELKDLGVGLAVDAFGTGYSSLSYLKRFPIDTLKIDQSFISDLDTPDGAAIIDAILALAKTLNLRSIAEGIENEDHMSYLVKNGCQLLQGYYFPAPCIPRTYRTHCNKITWT